MFRDNSPDIVLIHLHQMVKQLACLLLLASSPKKFHVEVHKIIANRGEHVTENKPADVCVKNAYQDARKACPEAGEVLGKKRNAPQCMNIRTPQRDEGKKKNPNSTNNSERNSQCPGVDVRENQGNALRQASALRDLLQIGRLKTRINHDLSIDHFDTGDNREIGVLHFFISRFQFFGPTGSSLLFAAKYRASLNDDLALF
jgi:hypothetical protein